MQEKVGALEKELSAKEAHLASLHQGEPGALIPETPAMRPTSGQSSEDGSAQCAQRYIEDVQKLKSWLGTHGYLSGGSLRSPLVLTDIPPEKQTVRFYLACVSSSLGPPDLFRYFCCVLLALHVTASGWS